MTAASLSLAASPLVVTLVVVLAVMLPRYRAERQRRRQRLARTLAELHLQRLTHQALAQLIAEARRTLADLNPRP